MQVGLHSLRASLLCLCRSCVALCRGLLLLSHWGLRRVSSQLLHLLGGWQVLFHAASQCRQRCAVHTEGGQSALNILRGERRDLSQGK